jgi:predicted amidohydrolase YtcJ
MSESSVSGTVPLSRRTFLEGSVGSVATLLAGCAAAGVLPRDMPLTLPKDPAELALLNGAVLTVDGKDRVAQAVSLAGGRIRRVGSTEEVLRSVGPETQVVDLKGATVTPGLIDAHNHMMYFGNQRKFFLDIRPPKVQTRDDLLRVVREAARVTPEGKWLFGGQGFPMRIGESPDRHDLDQAAPRHPVFLPHMSGQFGVANSLALRAGGVTRGTPDPPGGVIQKDPRTGEPTGRLVQYAAMDLVRRKPPPLSREQWEEAVAHAAGLYLPYGITSVQDVIVYYRSQVKQYERMAESAKLPIRLYLLQYVEGISHARQEAGQDNAFRHPMCTFGGWKLAVDGGPGSRTALMYNCQSDGCQRAFPLRRPEEINEITRLLHASGFQLSFHVVGDQAIDIALDAYESALRAAPNGRHRHRLEHVNFPNERNIARMKALGVVASVQPSWIHLFGLGYQWSMGPEVARRAIPVGTFLRTGIPVAFGSDVPATLQFEPQLAFYGAVARTAKARVGGYTAVLGLGEAISMREALRAHTATAAYAAFEEKEKGSIEEGKLADLAVWDENLYTVREDRILDLKVLMTIVDGRIVFSAKGSGLKAQKAAEIFRFGP